MMPGFIQIDSQCFYGQAWPQIKHRAREAHQRHSADESAGDYPVVAKSNWDDVKACIKSSEPAPPLVIYWGHKDAAGTGKTVLAITRSTDPNPDEYWIAADLIVE